MSAPGPTTFLELRVLNEMHHLTLFEFALLFNFLFIRSLAQTDCIRLGGTRLVTGGKLLRLYLTNH
jgi:hypothetical protein